MCCKFTIFSRMFQMFLREKQQKKVVKSVEKGVKTVFSSCFFKIYSLKDRICPRSIDISSIFASEIKTKAL